MSQLWRKLATFATRHRPAVAASGILALTIGLFALDLGSLWGLAVHPFGPSPWWGLLTVVPGCLLVAIHPARPLVALAVGAVLFALDFVWFGTVGMLLVLHELIYAATMSLTPKGRRWMLAILSALVAAVAIAAGVAAGQLRIAVLAGLLAFAILGTPFWWATAVRRAEEVAELHRRRAEDADRLAELRERDGVRRERQRMAGDLHDVIAGHLSAVALRSEAALAREPEQDGDRAALAAVREASLRSLGEMRSMILLLRSGEEPFTAADRLDRLPQIADDAAAGALDVRVEADELPDLPAAVDQAAARIVRESLGNAAKHAAGGTAVVRVAARTGELEVVVSSSGGAPVASPAGTGMGLPTMRERAEALGGRFRAGPADDGGWTVSASLPIGART